MKTLFSALALAILLILAPAFASATSLVCDPNPDFKKFDVEVNGAVVAEDFPAQPDGSIKFNVDYFNPGPYTFRIRPYGEGDWPGPWSDPFDANRPDAAGNVRLSKDLP